MSTKRTGGRVVFLSIETVSTLSQGGEGSHLNRRGLTQHACSCVGRVGRAAARLALEGGEEVLTQLLRDVVFEVGGHEELEALVVDGLRGGSGNHTQTCKCTLLEWTVGQGTEGGGKVLLWTDKTDRVLRGSLD